MVLTLDSVEVSLEEFITNPPEGKEWVEGAWIEKADMTIRHSKLQAELAYLWRSYVEQSNQGGGVYTELPCITRDRGRRPDVAYLTADLVAEYGDRPTLPHSPPLIAEIASPTDYAEELFSKAKEYLDSKCLEVWLVFPENNQVLIKLADRTLVFEHSAEISTQIALPGFTVSLNQLFA